MGEIVPLSPLLNAGDNGTVPMTHHAEIHFFEANGER